MFRNLSYWQTLSRQYGGWVLLVFHVVGTVLLGGDLHPSLVYLTPLNLMLVFALYLLASESISRPLFYSLPVLLGFIIEVIGTQTGWPFGAYSYSDVLGPRLFETPILIGVLWWVLLRSFDDLVGHRISNHWWSSVFVGLLMVMLDVLIEPVAIALNFWAWEAEAVPFENYVAWFVLSTIFARITISGRTRNPLSRWVVLVLPVFFLVLGFLLK